MSAFLCHTCVGRTGEARREDGGLLLLTFNFGALKLTGGSRHEFQASGAKRGQGVETTVSRETMLPEICC